MKRLMLFAAIALFMASCVKDDDCPKAVVDANALITPKLYATVENSSNTQSRHIDRRPLPAQQRHLFRQLRGR